MRISKDTLWKGLIEDFFPQLVAFFYPAEALLLDFGRVEFLDTELQQLAPEFKGRRRHVDKLVKVWRRDGTEAWILLHFEVQGYHDEEFALRMFTYAYRIFDRYGKLVEALAIFTDKDRNFHPKMFQLEAFQTRLDFRFQTYKVMDQNREDLLKSGNPIALALVVVWDEIHLKKKDDLGKLASKIQLSQLMLEQGYSEFQISRLIGFLKYYLRFSNRKMNATFEQSIIQLTQTKEPMGILERIQDEIKEQAYKQGFRSGRKDGLEKGKELGLNEGKELWLNEGLSKGKELGLNEGLSKGKELGLNEGLSKGKELGLNEGLNKGKQEGEILGRIKTLVSLLLSSMITITSNEDLATTFQLPLAWVERIRKGDVPGIEEVRELLASQNGDENGHSH